MAIDVAQLLGPELADLATALGLAQSDGELNSHWFDNPLTQLGTILTNETQRAALFDLLDEIIPTANVPGADGTAKYYPLLPTDGTGNIYLTVDDAVTPAIVGVAASYSAATNPNVSVLASLPLLNVGDQMTPIAGSPSAPLTAALTIDVSGLTTLFDSITADISVSSAGGSLNITLQNLTLEGETPQDVTLGADGLGGEAAELLVGLLRAELENLSGATGEAASLVANLFPLLGFGSTVPTFPITTLATDPHALMNWLQSLTAGDPAPIGTWLGYLAGLLGAPAPTVTGPSPWNLPVFSSSGSSFGLTFSRTVATDGVTPVLSVGVEVVLASSLTAIGKLEIDATLVELPLVGAVAPQIFPSASVTAVAPADGSTPLVAPGGAFSVDSVSGGIRWDGASLAPLLELTNVTFNGQNYAVVDLTDAKSLVAAAGTVVATQLEAALGGSAEGSHLLALVGLTPPAAAPAAPTVDLALLVSSPLQAVASLYRNSLATGTPSWSAYFDELLGLLALSGASGAGTPSDPWVSTIATAGPLTVQLAAWNAQTSGVASDPQLLRVGVRVQVTAPTVSGWWLSELVAIDLPDGSAAAVRVLSGHAASIEIVPGTVDAVAGVAFSADSITVTAELEAGSPPAVGLEITNLVVAVSGATVTLPSLAFPFPVGFDITSPTAFGVSAPDFQFLVLNFLFRQLTLALGGGGLAIGALFGLSLSLPGFQIDFPKLGAISWSNPFPAFKLWFLQVASGQSSDGSSFISSFVGWLYGFLAGVLPDDMSSMPDLSGLKGSGTYADPWSLPIGESGVAALLWLDPDGPPVSQATAAAAFGALSDFDDLVDQLTAWAPLVPDLPDGLDPAVLSTGLSSLSDHLSSTDGVVPTTAQTPTGAAWTSGTAVSSAHTDQLGDPSARSQITAQLDSWAAAGSRAVLLLGPAFSNHEIWQPLLGDVETAHPDTTSASALFNFRVEGVAPTSVDLRGVTETVDFYAADLNDDGTGSAANTASLLTQIDLALDQIIAVRPGVPLYLVAHSTAGLAACAYAAAHAARVSGLVTIGTPFTGAPLTPLTDSSTAEALRWYADQLPDGLPAGPLNDALTTLVQALDGYQPPPAAGEPPIAWPFPVGDFIGAASTDTGGVAALAIPGELGGASGVDLLAALGAAIGTQINAVTYAPPTVLGLGLRADLDLGPSSTIAVDGSLRFDLYEVPLQQNATSPHPVPAFTIAAKTYEPGGWLVGGPSAYAGVGAPDQSVRVRSLELALAISLSQGEPGAAVTVALQDAAFDGVTISEVGWGDPGLEAPLGAVFRALSASSAAPSSSLGTLLAFLQALQLVVPDPHGGLAFGSDALTALEAEPLAFLSASFSTAFADGGLLGLGPPNGGAYVLPVTGTGVDVSIGLSPATVGAATPSGSPLTLSEGVTVGFSASLNVATLVPSASVTVGLGPAILTWTPTSLTLGIEGILSPLELIPPPSAAAAEAAFGDAVLNLLISTAGSALLSSLVDPELSVGDIMEFLSTPGEWLVGPNALGSGGTLDPTKLNALFERIASALGQPPGGLTLPGGLALSASSSTGPPPTTNVNLATTAPIGGVLGLELAVAVEAARHVIPSGTVTLDVAALAGGTWGSLTVDFGASASGLTLTVTPGAGGSPVELLPSFSGASALVGTAQALLPAVLSELGTTITIPTVVLELAEALGLYDAGTTTWNTAALQQVTNPGWFAGLSNQAALLTSIANALNASSLGLPAAITASGTSISLTYPPAGSPPSPLESGTQFTLTAGWDASGTTIVFGVTDFAVDNAPINVDLSFGWALGNFVLDGFVGLDLSTVIGTGITPGLSLAVANGQPVLSFLPLGSGPPPVLSVELMPAFQAPNLDPADLETVAVGLLEHWALPLVVDLLTSVLQAELSKTIGSTGQSAGGLLVNAGVLTFSGGKYQIASSLPSISELPGKIAGALAAVTWPSIDLGSDLTLELGTYAVGARQLVGLTLKGTVALNEGGPQVSMLLGAPATWLAPDPGVGLYLFDTSSFSLVPVLHVMGLGVGLAGSGDDALLSTSFVRIQALQGYVAFDVDFAGPSLSGAGGGLDIVQLGLPLGAIDSTSSSNPVASSLLGSTGSTSGDPTSAMPAVDVSVYSLNGDLTVKFAAGQPLVVPVHQSFGPLYIDQIDLSTTSSTTVEIGVDANVQVAGLQVDLDQLSLSVPIQTVGDPSTWSVDLQGLAVSYSETPVEISGGLIKVQGPSAIEYDGMLSVSIEEFGLTAVGSYARPSDVQGSYTSVFIFVTVMVPLGGPPFLFITGLAGGFGYNREILVPTDVDELPAFTLVEAMNDDSLANDPMSALTQMGSAMPPKRGAYWIAAGVDFTSFALVNSTAIVVIALDRGFEIDVIGVSRMALPTEDVALVSVELALLARYNSAEGVLSVQAQLTDNSYLFSPDCQLTGGFAFFIWFPQGQFVLTLGGYNSVAFAKPPQFPDVPRLGFNWDLDSALVIKGGAYFALTETCVMAGGSLSATLNLGPISAWLDVYLDFLVSWDPFAYEFDVGVEIGVSLSIQICFFGCVNIGVTLSLGASLAILGPPFHGTASVQALVTTVTVEFGASPTSPSYITDWGVFAGKYLTPGDPDQTAVSVQMRTGVLVPNPPGAQPQPGTASQPWQLGAEFSLVTTTRMPANQVTFSLAVPVPAVTGVNAIDLAPMDILGVTSAHSLTLTPLDAEAGPTSSQLDQFFTVTVLNGPFPEATWHWMDPQHLPAAARTITAVTGLSLDAHVVLPDQSATIPIGTLTDDEPNLAKPLPFATTSSVVPILKTYGSAADELETAITGASPSTVEKATENVLSGGGVFAANRASVGMTAAGLSSLGVASLSNDRSSPPLLTSIATGLTMLPVGLEPARLPVALVPDGSVILEAPRLKAVLRTTLPPVVDTSPAVRTSVATAAGVVRMAPPSPAAVVGAKLLLVPAATSPRPTKAALLTRTVRNGNLGSPIGPGEQEIVAGAATELSAGGVTLGAGVSHLWEVPDSGGIFAVTGGGAVRMVYADRSGHVLDDIEFLSPGSVAVPAGTELVVVSCLGAPPPNVARVTRGFGSVELTNAPAGQSPVVGWQTSSELAQIGSTTFLARGASLSVPRSSASGRLGQLASYGMVTGATALAGQQGVETTLPAGVDVVIVGLDVADPTAARNGDLAIGVVGATLASPPVRVLAGDRRVLLYTVASGTSDGPSMAVSAASDAGWSLAAVAGVRGNANEWAAALSDGIPDQFVPNGPLSPGASITVTYTPKEGS